jgi:hypothetical protein
MIRRPKGRFGVGHEHRENRGVTEAWHPKPEARGGCHREGLRPPSLYAPTPARRRIGTLTSRPTRRINEEVFGLGLRHGGLATPVDGAPNRSSERYMLRGPRDLHGRETDLPPTTESTTREHY